MAREYYCLIAGLAEYSFDTDGRKLKVRELRDEIKAELSAQDLHSLELLYTYYDIENIINHINSSSLPFNQLGNLSLEEIAQEIDPKTDDQFDESDNTPSRLPSSIRLIIDRYKGRIDPETLEEQEPELSASEVERLLYRDFYLMCEQSRCQFLKEWFDTDRKIRNISTAYRARVLGLDYLPMLVGSGDVESMLITSQAADFGLRGGEFEYAEALLQVLETQDFVERERNMDTLRWSIVESLTEQEYFNIATLLAYLIKLNILYRWAALDKQVGQERFRSIVGTLTNHKVE